MNANVISIAEKKNKKKSLTTTLIIHASLIVLGLIPFAITQEIPVFDEPMVLVEFSAQASSSSATQGSPETKEVKMPPLAQPEKPKEEPKAAKPVKKVLTSSTKEVRIPKNRERIIEKKTPAKKAPEKKVEKTKTSAPATPSDNLNKPSGQGGNSAGNSKNEGSNTGMEAGIFEGDGLLKRRVTYRADVKSLTREEGKIVINICVDREGKVTYADYNKKDSTIKTRRLSQEAEITAKNYRFERDYTVSDKQCGKLTFIFDL